MAHQSLSKVVPIPEPITAPQEDSGVENTPVESPDFAGIALYLSNASEARRGEFHFTKRQKINDAERRMKEAVRDLITEEAERLLSIWISSHPDRDSWKQEQMPAKGNFHSAERRDVIRRAYARFGCDGCDRKDEPHYCDGLCRRCYGRRASRRRLASMEFADSTPQRPGGRTKPREDAQG